MMVHSSAVGNREECVFTGRDLLPAERYWVSKLNFGDRVGARSPEFTIRHEPAEDLAVVLVWTRIIHFDIGQPNTLFYHCVLTGSWELYFFLFRRPQSAG